MRSQLPRSQLRGLRSRTCEFGIGVSLLPAGEDNRGPLAVDGSLLGLGVKRARHVVYFVRTEAAQDQNAVFLHQPPQCRGVALKNGSGEIRKHEIRTVE